MTRSRTLISILLIVSLLLTAGARWLSDRQRHQVLTHNGTQPLPAGGATNLSSMNSFALALLLGGLRGPLVMILWQQSEAQKQQRNLEDFDTRVEWIRMLQPEFDSVHIFQIWNKAYNVSAQMASLSNKYVTILDALDYAYRTDQQRPHNINLITAIAQIYFDKLGSSAERDYYRPRIRQESQWRPTQQQSGAGMTLRTNRLDPRLDPEGYILDQYLQETLPRPGHLPADQPWTTGADLQYLQSYQPFPYGISPYAFAYNYYKRAQVLQDATGQEHANFSRTVIDSRPALALKNWAEAERERSLRLEADYLGVRPLTDQEQEHQGYPFGGYHLEPAPQLELLTAELAPADAPLAIPNLPELLHSYQRAASVADDAIAEYERHLDVTTNIFNTSTYESHMDHLRAIADLSRGDSAFLQALSAPADSAQRQTYLEQAQQAYRDTIAQSHLIMLRYYTDNNVLSQIGTDRDQVRDATPDQRAEHVQQAAQIFAAGTMDYHVQDRAEYGRYAQRAQTRLNLLTN